MERINMLEQTVSHLADFHWPCKPLISLNVCPSAEFSIYVVDCAQTRILEQKQRCWPKRAVSYRSTEGKKWRGESAITCPRLQDPLGVH